jgi:hypothetical protein
MIGKGLNGATVALVDGKYKGAPAVELCGNQEELGVSARDWSSACRMAIRQSTEAINNSL